MNLFEQALFEALVIQKMNVYLIEFNRVSVHQAAHSNDEPILTLQYKRDLIFHTAWSLVRQTNCSLSKALKTVWTMAHKQYSRDKYLLAD